jgi:hypothetical protein
MLNTGIIEKLFVSDLAYLQDLYNQVNYPSQHQPAVTCPKCEHNFQHGTAKMGKA